ncbi:hypothetical protein N9887_03530 [Flavobacteriaceae bacterium]|nr:hypothetical protein [Flavobacteriaceae bacterium]
MIQNGRPSIITNASIDDDIPIESTYHEFRRRLSNYTKNHDIDG